jgi:hypothetical protein
MWPLPLRLHGGRRARSGCAQRCFLRSSTPLQDEGAEKRDLVEMHPADRQRMLKQRGAHASVRWLDDEMVHYKACLSEVPPNLADWSARARA